MHHYLKSKQCLPLVKISINHGDKNKENLKHLIEVIKKHKKKILGIRIDFGYCPELEGQDFEEFLRALKDSRNLGEFSCYLCKFFLFELGYD